MVLFRKFYDSLCLRLFDSPVKENLSVSGVILCPEFNNVPSTSLKTILYIFVQHIIFVSQVRHPSFAAKLFTDYILSLT